MIIKKCYIIHVLYKKSKSEKNQLTDLSMWLNRQHLSPENWIKQSGF